MTARAFTGGRRKTEKRKKKSSFSKSPAAPRLLSRPPPPRLLSPRPSLRLLSRWRATPPQLRSSSSWPLRVRVPKRALELCFQALAELRRVEMSSSSAAALARGKSGISAAKFEASKGLGAKPKRSASATGSRGKTEKKVYSLPGQKFDPPEEREPLRIFYESLSKQIPSSEMAEFCDQLYYPSTSSTKMYNRLMEHGLLSPERAKKAYEKKQKRQQQIRSGTPIKPSVKKDKPESSKKPSSYNSSDSKAKKRVDYSDDDDDFIVKLKRSRG
uniref:Uncharacterized protein n=1 Tax=Oryza meridionalis TaxID=40149 RepID=A0A0E0DVA9_9ORYZ